MKTPPLYTMRFAFQQICEGQGLWIALGNFLNYWFEDAKDHRADLVTEPLQDAKGKSTGAGRPIAQHL